MTTRFCIFLFLCLGFGTSCIKQSDKKNKSNPPGNNSNQNQTVAGAESVTATTPAPTLASSPNPAPTSSASSSLWQKALDELSSINNGAFSTLLTDKELRTSLLALYKDRDPAVAVGAIGALLGGADVTTLRHTLSDFVSNPKSLDDFLASVQGSPSKLKNFSTKLMSKLNVSEARQQKILGLSWFQKIDGLLNAGKITDAKTQLLVLLGKLAAGG